MSQLVFQEDITIFENNNFLASQHRSLAAFPGSARQRCFLGMCGVSSPGLLRLPGFYRAIGMTRLIFAEIAVIGAFWWKSRNSQILQKNELSSVN